jgi:hypothetical protein
MYGILVAGKPVLAVAPSETDAASLGTRQGFALSCDPDRPEEVVATVRQVQANPARLAAMGRAARAAAADYDRAGEAQKFEQILTHIANTRE